MATKPPMDTDEPATVNEHAHAFATAAEGLDGINHSRVKRGAFTAVSYVSLWVHRGREPGDLELETLASMAEHHGATNANWDPVARKMDLTFARGGDR